jgi:WD40 repeat protein
MGRDTHIDELLSLHEAAQASGRPLSPEELCRDCPDLLDDVKRRLANLRVMDSLLASGQDRTDSGSMPEGAAPPSIAGYEVLGELGRGGMGVVYQVWQEQLGRMAALKMISAVGRASPEEQRRFRIGAEATARMQHPNIVQVFEIGEHNGQPYLVLEFVDGDSLARRLAGTPLDPRRAAELVETLAGAIHYSHGRGVVHRDLTPSNVLLTADGTPKITDFGLAKLLTGGAERTVSGAVLGTPSYMAPEQAAGKVSAISPATDVYALGAILYELLVGRAPFRADTTLETLRQVVWEEPVSPRRLQPHVPRDLETICLKCLEKEPARRYASAQALAEDLGRFQNGEPIHVRPPSARRRAAHWVRRHPAAATLMTAAGLLALTITLGAVWHSAQLTDALEGEQRQRQEANRNEERARRSEARAGQLAYASDMRLASQLLHTGDIYHFSDLLDHHLPEAGTNDRREFGWFYLRPFSRPPPPPAPQAHQPGYVAGVAFSADGRLLASAGWESVARVWELPQGNCRRTIPFGDGLLALCPDGRTLAVVSSRQSHAVRLLDLATGEERAVLQHPPNSGVGRLLLSADGQTLATVAADVVRLWDARSLQQRGQFTETEGEYLILALSPDGNSLATVTRKNPALLRIRNLPGGGIRREVDLGADVLSLTYSPWGNLLAASRRDGGVYLFRTGRGQLVEWRFLRQGSSVVAFSPDERWLAIGVGEQVHLWDLHDGTWHNRLRWQASYVSALAFSPDGRVLAVGTGDGRLHRVNPDCPPAHETLRAVLRHNGPLAVSHDGKTLALPDEDGTVKLVDAVTGEVRLILAGHGSYLNDCVFSPDDRTLATAGNSDAEVRLWDTASGREKKRFQAGLLGIDCLAFSPRGGLLAAGENGDAVWVWDLASGDLRGKLPGHHPGVLDLAFSPNGRVLASCNGSTIVRLWDIPPQGPIPERPREKVTLPGGVNAVAFVPTGQTLAVGGHGGEVPLLSVPDTGPCQRVGPPLAIEADGWVLNLAFAPDGRSLLVGRNRATPTDWGGVSVWDVASPPGRTSFRYCHLDPGRKGVAWMPDGRLLEHSGAGVVEVRDLRTGSVFVPGRQALWPVSSRFLPGWPVPVPGHAGILRRGPDPHRAPRLPFISGDQWIQQERKCSGNVADAVRVCDMDRLAPGPRLPGEQGLALPGRIALSPDGRLLAAGGPDGSVRLWDLAGRKLFARLFISEKARAYARKIEPIAALWPFKPEYPAQSEGVQSLAFSPDCRWLAAAGEHGTVILWDTDGWKGHHPLAGPQEGAAWVGFSPDSVLAIACKGQVRLYDPRTGAGRATLGAETDPPILSGAFSPDGHLLAAGTLGQTIRVWDLRTAENRTLTGHMNQVAAVGFSPDGKTLASGDWSGIVKLWSVPTLQEVATLEAHGGRVHCLAFSPDGTVLATGAEGGLGRGEVFLWRAERP